MAELIKDFLYAAIVSSLVTKSRELVDLKRVASIMVCMNTNRTTITTMAMRMPSARRVSLLHRFMPSFS